MKMTRTRGMIMKSKKTWRILGIALLLAMLFLLLAVAGLAIGQSEDTPEMSIVANNLSFSDSVYIKYAVAYENVSDVENVKLLVWQDGNGEYTLETADAELSPVGRAQVAGKECLIFDYCDLAAKQMTDNVYARAICEEGGNVYYSDVKKYSILTYAYNKLGYTGTATQNEDLAALLHGLLKYGASAQTFFNYKTDALATDKHVKVTLDRGTFADGCKTALAIPGTKLTVTAPEISSLGSFAYWQDENGQMVSDSASYEIVVGASNTTLKAVYSEFKGGEIEGAGAILPTYSFAYKEHPINEENIVDLTAAEFESLIRAGIKTNTTYRITDGNPVTVTRNLNGKGSALIAPMGVIIDNGSSISVSDIIISGSVKVISSNNVSLARVEVQSNETALSIDSYSSDVTVNDCRFFGADGGVESYASNTTVKDSYISGVVTGRADGFAIHNCKVVAKSNGITLCGSDISATNNTVTSENGATGITVESGSLNSLLSYNIISGAGTAVKVSGSTNTVVIFNSGFNTVSEDNINLYIVENSIGGSLILKNNDYLLCDSNSYLENGQDHALVLESNQNINGDTLMDVNARNEVGAKEELLPHTNKELFLEMPRRSTVKDIAGGTALDLNTYIENNAKTGSVVIVPPGAYYTAAGDPLSLTAEMNNTEIYAFGVYNEHDFNTNAEYLANKGGNQILTISGAENINIHGITLGYDYQASGQVHVLKKLDDQQILVVPAAGYDLSAGFGQSNLDVFHNSYTYKFGAGTLYSATGGSTYTLVSTNDDGTLVLKLSTVASYDAMNVGDIIVCRMAGDNQHTIGIGSSKNIKLKDVILHGYSSALMTVVTGSSTDVSLERVHNTARAPYIIDKETYDMYAAWEKEYGVDLEIYIDELGRYRGSIPRVGSVDATHVSGSSEGLDITSCLFENMCDDGSNQRGSSSRLSGIKDNGDGTTTLYFKGMVTSTYHGIYKTAKKTQITLNPLSFSEGDNIYVYSSKGVLLCDTECLTDSKSEDDLIEIFDFDTIRYFIHVRSVKVSTDAVNFDALEGYDLSDHHYSMKNKILVDNISHVSQGFVADNLMVRNSTARGILIKTVNATVKNCTFRNVAGTGNLLSVETSWGESTVTRNATITGCLFDSCGISTDDPIRANVAISGLSTYGQANVDSLRASDILITGCEFRNYGHQFGIYVNGAQNVKIIDNVFDPKDEVTPGNFVKILTALNVELSGNKYKDSNGTLSTISNIDAEDYTHIHGSDVGDTFKADCDICVGSNHLSSMRIYYSDKANRDIASVMAQNLADVCGYSVSYSGFFKENVIKLVTLDQSSDAVSSASYTVTSNGKDLTITAATRASLIYAVEDFVEYIRQRSKTEQTIIFKDGFSMTRSFDLNTSTASNTSLFKYSGLWSASGACMSSLTDADYVEFDVTGNAFTLLFSDKTEFDLFIDGEKFGTYTAESEMTFCIENGTHTVKVLCKDTKKTLSFAGIRYLGAGVTRTSDRSHYIQFIGDSMVDGERSFAHTLGNTLGWDYSVMVGDTLPDYADTGRTPDVVIIFLGTDALSSSTSQNDANAFVQRYEDLVRSINSKYGSSTKIHLMQALSTSDASAMFNTDHIRYRSISTVMNNCSDLANVNTINAATVQSWGVEFDSAKDTTTPTPDGYDTLVSRIAMYISAKSGYTDYYNHSFDLNKMKNYNGQMQTGLSEDGISFSRYNFIDKNGNPINGHVFISGDDYANRIVTDSGRYLIFKFRSTADYSIAFNMRTNDYGTNVAESGKGYVSSVSRTASSLSTDWETAVIDLAQFDHYTTGTHIGVQVRITTTASEIDIADVTIVDTISDANLYILSELGEAEYYFYERWDMQGVRTSITGKELIEEEEETVDLSYVNHNFNLIAMYQYDNQTNKLGAPDGLLLSDDDGTVYNRFVINGTGHIFFKGKNVLSEINGDTGNYLVFKYRTPTASNLGLEMQTSDLPYNSSRPNDTMLRITKPAASNPDGWEIAVVDLAQYTSYTRDADLNVLIRITTTASEFNLAYAAIVDDISEAERYISAMGDSSYVHYTNWAGAGTQTAID